MGGIWAIFCFNGENISYLLNNFFKIKHRGKVAWRLESDYHVKDICFGFHRNAAIEGNKMQPLRTESLPHLWIIFNGEIFNCEKLRIREQLFHYTSNNDIEIILHLYHKEGIEFCVSHLDGEFGFCLLDTEKKKCFLSRDTYGAKPIFKLFDEKGFLGVSSEAKGLIEICQLQNGSANLKSVSPGSIEEYNVLDVGKISYHKTIVFHKIGEKFYYEPSTPWQEVAQTSIQENIRTLLKASVKKRITNQRKIGCLLSGGLNSSIISALLVQVAKEEQLIFPVQTFAIGMKSSPDIQAARKVANYIGSQHHEIIFTPQEAFQSLEKVIYHLESYDIMTVRDGVGMYLIGKYIAEKTDCVLILCGEGLNEIAQGFIYFRDAPSSEVADEESRRLLNDLHYFHLLRADRTFAAHGLQLKTPFLDDQFINFYFQIPSEMRISFRKMTKYLIRESFAETGLLPQEIIWRQQETVSDGFTEKEKSFFVYIQEFVEHLVDQDSLLNAPFMYPHNTPTTKEAFYYRQVFECYFPEQSEWIPYFWMPKWTSVNSSDPSARFLPHYSEDDN